MKTELVRLDVLLLAGSLDELLGQSTLSRGATIQPTTLDSKAIAQLYTEDGEFTGARSDTLRGRSAIERYWANEFALPGAKSS